MGEEDAGHYRYSIWAGQGIAMEWVKPEYNHGPFILMHGDLRPPNIVIDDNYNIISILDWEWSHTIPLQLFAVSPYWLTNLEVLQISKPLLSSPYKAAALDFANSLYGRLYTYYNPGRLPRLELSLSKIWNKQVSNEANRTVALGLLKPHYFGNVYCHILDPCYYGQNRDKRVEEF